LLGPVPIDERFYAGGRTTHRAFGQDELGIEGQTLVAGTPIGGAGLLLVNLDYRFPIAGAIGGTVFVDGGNVWRDYAEIDTGDLRWGAGVGLRYRSPVGPLRLEIGWKLDREPGEPAYVWFFSIGNPF
jgi:outer membrane protein insertion porin family